MNDKKAYRLRPETVGFIRHKVIPVVHSLNIASLRDSESVELMQEVEKYRNPNYRGTSETLQTVMTYLRRHHPKQVDKMFSNWESLLFTLLAEVTDEDTSERLSRWEISFVRSLEKDLMNAKDDNVEYRIRIGQYSIICYTVKHRLNMNPWS